MDPSNIIEEHRLQKTKKHQSLIVVFIYLSIFINSIVFFRDPFEFYLGYLIYIVLLPIFMRRYGTNRQLTLVFFVLFITGMFNIAMGNNTIQLFIKVFLGLTLSYYFYYYVILEYKYDVEKLFIWYLKGSYYAAVIGLVQFVSFQIGFKPGYDYRWLLNKWGVVFGGNFGIRVNSIFGEPTYLAATLSAAFFVALYNLLRQQSFGISRTQSLIIVIVYLLSFSGLGQMGVFVSLVMLAISFGLVRYIFIAIPAAFLLFSLLYNNVSDFRERFDSTVGLFSGGVEKFQLGKTHGSSFILYNNYKVAMQNFQSNFFFGSGIGSHPVAFQKYSIARDWKVAGFNANGADANSMLLRLISETGIFGVSIFLFIVFKCYVVRRIDDETNHWLIANAILVMLLLNLFRQGHYFLNGFPFFVLLYIYNKVSYLKFLSESNSEVSEEKN